MPVTRDPRIDNPGIVGFDVFRTETPALHRTGSKVFDNDICLGEKVKRDFATFVGFQIEGNAFLVARQRVIPQRHPVADFAPLANGVAGGRLDFYDLGAKVTQHGACKGSCKQLAHFNNAQTFQRTIGIHRSFS